jgi:hypothetical protein
MAEQSWVSHDSSPMRTGYLFMRWRTEEATLVLCATLLGLWAHRANQDLQT